MTVSPGSSSLASSAMFFSVTSPEGSITHTARGFFNCLTTLSRSLAPAALAEHAEIAARLRRFDHAEAVLRSGHGQILRVVAGDLQEHAAVGPALVRLAGRVQETRAEADAGRRLRPVAHERAQGLQAR